MMYSTLEPDALSMREVYVKTITELLSQDPKIVLGEADLGRAVYGAGYAAFRQSHQKQSFDVGVAEGNLVGVGCGLALAGMIPVLHTFACFLTRRAYDTIFVSAAYAGLHLKLIGSDPGVTAAHNGGTHMTFEDMGVLRGIPNITLLDFTDNVMLASVLPQVIYAQGLVYCRLLRGIRPASVYRPDTAFTIGKAQRLREGKDATIIASGILVAKALQAADRLDKEGIQTRVVDMFTWKPIDRAEVIAAAAETGAIVTAENHNCINGLFSAVNECLAGRYLSPVVSCSSSDAFGTVGELPALEAQYGMTAEGLAEKTREAVALKGNSAPGRRSRGS